MDESAATWPGVADEDGDPADFEKLRVHKRGCELAVEQTYGLGASLVARAGSIVGPHDNLGQLPWWLTRIAEGGRVIAPGDPARGLQLIDVRDVSTFVLDQVEAQAGGIHNVVPDEPDTTMGQLIDNCVQATGSDATPVWMDEGFLCSQGVQPWAELPLWIPNVPDAAGFWPCPALQRKRQDCAPARSATRSGAPGSGCSQAARSRPRPAPRHSASPATKSSRCWPRGIPSCPETIDLPRL